MTLYSKPGCVHCDSAKAWLAQHAFDFQTIDVTENSEAMAFVVANGHRTVPQIYHDGTLLVSGGYAGLNKLSPDDLRSLLT
jgi:glutaredoxin